jgi:glycosyltransferase involved in cell wall biosynthesis
MSITSVGRITKIKNLDSILLEISRLRSATKQNISLEFVGNVQDPTYKKELELMASSLNLNLRFHPPLQYDTLSKYYNSQSIYFTGTPKSTDKATLEAAFCGCFVFSNNADALKLTGMQFLYGNIEENELPSIPDQLERIFGLDAKSETTLRQLISDEAIRQNDVNKTVAQILNYLKGKYE